MNVKNLLKSILLLHVLSLAACEADDSNKLLQASDYQVTISSVEDISENGDASDILITMSGGALSDEINEYRIIVATSSTDDDLVKLESTNLPESRFQVVANTSQHYEINLDSELLDFAGDLITEDVEYHIWVLSVFSHEDQELFVITGPSSPITLRSNTIVSTLVRNIDSNDGLTIDADGNVYASEFGDFINSGGDGTRVLKITPSGTVSTYVDQLNGPLGINMDDSNNLYIIDGNNGSSGNVIKVSPEGTKTTLATIDGWPAGVVSDQSGNLYISNYSTPNLYKITPTGEISIAATDARLQGCVGIDLSDDGDVLVSNYNDGAILSVDIETSEVTMIYQIPDLPSGFAIGYMVYFENAVYATGIGSHRIYKVGLDGSFEVFAGNGNDTTTDGTLTEASFKHPNGIAVDEENRIIYVQQWGSQSLRKIKLSE